MCSEERLQVPTNDILLAVEDGLTVYQIAEKFNLQFNQIFDVLGTTPAKPKVRMDSSFNDKPYDLDFLAYDDSTKQTVWGVNKVALKLGTRKQISIDEIYKRFHGEAVCAYCGAKTNLKVDFKDARTENFLISNIEYVCKDCFVKRFGQTTVMQISKEFEMHTSHWLYNYNGKCRKMHGHTYKLIVTLEKPLDRLTGMVEDFGSIKQAVTEWVVDTFDHNVANYVLPPQVNPTAEIMALWIWKVLAQKALVKGLHKVTLYETATSKVTVTSETMQSLVLAYLPELFENKQPSKLIQP